MISKELLSEVLGGSIQSFQFDMGYIDYQINEVGGYDDTINIYELAHKCKVWAIKEGYLVISSVRNIVISKGSKTVYTDIVNMGSEPEAVFKACEYILDNKETK